MNREHLYRAKRVNWREHPKEEWWVEGDLIHEPYGTVIQYYEDEIKDKGSCAKASQKKRMKVVVDPETVCEYTGSTDKNRKKIFEWDILKLPAWITNHGEYVVCEYIDSKNEVVEIIGFALFDVNKKLINSDEWDEFEVNGNIFDNPDLLKE